MSSAIKVYCAFVCGCLCLSPEDALAASESNALELSLSAGWVSRADGRRELTALFSVGVPLDRSARLRLPDTGRARFAEGAGPTPTDPRASETAPTESAARRTVLLVVTPQLAQAALRAAFRAAGRPGARARFSSLSSRARASAALPILRLRAARTTDESLRLTPTSSDPYRYTQAGGVSIALEAQATWKLDRAVFADEEIQVEHLRRLRAREDARLTQEVLQALFSWQRALSGSAEPDAPPEERELAELRVFEAEVRLDLLTGGWFHTRAAALRKNALSRARRSE